MDAISVLHSTSHASLVRIVGLQFSPWLGFLLSRIQEEWLRTRDNRYAVARGLEKTGGVITNAALLFVIVTGAFAFTRLVITKEIGLGMTVAVLVDATVIRTLLVPATMRLLGRWNWWLPGHLAPVAESTSTE